MTDDNINCKICKTIDIHIYHIYSEKIERQNFLKIFNNYYIKSMGNGMMLLINWLWHWANKLNSENNIIYKIYMKSLTHIQFDPKHLIFHECNLYDNKKNETECGTFIYYHFSTKNHHNW